jgi:hypothetical protein
MSFSGQSSWAEMMSPGGMDKLKLIGWNLGWVFNNRLGHACIGIAIVHITKQPNLKLKTRPKQLLGSLLLAFALPTGGQAKSTGMPPVQKSEQNWVTNLSLYKHLDNLWAL